MQNILLQNLERETTIYRKKNVQQLHCAFLKQAFHKTTPQTEQLFPCPQESAFHHTNSSSAHPNRGRIHYYDYNRESFSTSSKPSVGDGPSIECPFHSRFRPDKPPSSATNYQHSNVFGTSSPRPLI